MYLDTFKHYYPHLFFVQMHIAGHAGYKGNEEADRLSREGAAKHPVFAEEDDF